MPTTPSAPANRTPIRLARGSFQALKASEAQLLEGELVYAEDLRALFVCEDPAISGGSSGAPRGLVAVGASNVFIPPPPTRLVFVGDMSVPGNAPATPSDGDLAISNAVDPAALCAADWIGIGGAKADAGSLFIHHAGNWLPVTHLAPGGGASGGASGGGGAVVPTPAAGVNSVGVQPPLQLEGDAANPIIKLPPATLTEDGAFSAADKAKLEGIKQEQADWSESQTTAAGFIKNKPGVANETTPGLMSPAQLAKLDGGLTEVEHGTGIRVTGAGSIRKVAFVGAKLNGVIFDGESDIDVPLKGPYYSGDF